MGDYARHRKFPAATRSQTLGKIVTTLKERHRKMAALYGAESSILRRKADPGCPGEATLGRHNLAEALQSSWEGTSQNTTARNSKLVKSQMISGF